MERSTCGPIVSANLAIDQQHIWHPFTQHATSAPSLCIERGEGVYLYTDQGERYLDAISSWYTSLHGHCHPQIVKSIREQTATLDHIMFAGLTHQPACELAKKLLDILPDNLNRVFYADNGSTAIEAAVKIAIQYWYNQEESRLQIVTFRNGYHGDTLGSMSVADRGPFSTPFQSHLFDITLIDPPEVGKEKDAYVQLQKAIRDKPTACFIFEPLLQGIAGFRTYSLTGLDKLIGLCREQGVITIADEVLTGLGRTGPLFCSSTLENKPDMICLAKGLTGGSLTLAAVACTEHIFAGFLSSERRKAFLHGHSYTANPIACAAALANLRILDTKECEDQRQFIQKQHEAFRLQWGNHPRLKRCEVIGTILALDYVDDQHSYYSTFRDRLLNFFMERRILLRPFGNNVHVIPPYCITREELNTIYQALSDSLEEL